MKGFQFQDESPSGEDKFLGGGHQRTADAVLNTLVEDNGINVVGIEGPLGSGKSTVIELMRKRLEEVPKNENYKIIDFNVEKYQHGATKKALIETIFGNMKGFFEPSRSEGALNAKQIALGNKLDYSVNVNSHFNGWVIAFAISVLFAVGAARDALSGLGYFLEFIFLSRDYQIDFKYFLAVLFLLSPFIIVLFSSCKLFSGLGVPAISDLFKRTGSDRVNESFDITREVGAYELEMALKEFQLSLRSGVKIILVIDNIDRVTDDKLREVWSDIDVFKSIANEQIQVLIPYSAVHVEEILNKNPERKDVNIGREFISKRIPITFRVSPIVTADWRMEFERMAEQSISNMPKSEISLSTKLITLWIGDDEEITPRYLKRLINLVVSSMQVKAEDINPANAFYYYLAVYLGGITLDGAASDKLKPKGVENDVLDRLFDSMKILKERIPLEKITRDLASIHFQTNYDIAESELLRKPIINALEKNSPKALLRKQNILGYKSILQDILDEAGTEKLVLTMNVMIREENYSESVKNWMEDFLPMVNEKIDVDSFEIDDMETYINACDEILSAGHELSLSKLKSAYDGLNKPEHEIGVDDIGTLYRLSRILDKKPNIISEINAEIYYHLLWPMRAELPDWNIERIRLSEELAHALLEEFDSRKKNYSDEPILDSEISLAEHILSIYRLGWKQFKSKEPLPLVPNQLLDSWPNAVSWNIFKVDWESLEVNSILSLISESNNEKVQEMLRAQAIMVCVSNDQSIPQSLFVDVAVDTDYLASCLASRCSLSDIFSSLELDRGPPVLMSALESLIQEFRVARLSLGVVLEKFNLLSSSTQLSNEQIFSWLNEWKLSTLTLPNFLAAHSEAIEGICLRGAGADFGDRFSTLIEEQDEHWWAAQIAKPDGNLRLFLTKYFAESNRKLQRCANLSKAIIEMVSDEETLGSVDKSWLTLLMSILVQSSRGRVLGAARTTLNTYQYSGTHKLLLIQSFGADISLDFDDTERSAQVLIYLLGKSVSDTKFLKWLNAQEIQLKKWSAEKLDELCELIVSHPEVSDALPNITKHKLIKTKLSNLEEE